MPLVHPSTYRPPPGLTNGHLQTVAAGLLRRVRGVRYRRSRITTPDGDFLDVDVSSVGADRAAVVLHGLEGSSRAAYVLGAVKRLNRDGWDALAVNFRGCSGVPNRRYRAYHAGATDDLAFVLASDPAADGYRELALVGFSLGGNVVLRYLGDEGRRAADRIRVAAAVSAPCDLAASARRMDSGFNRLYTRRFLSSLRRKAVEKCLRFPGGPSPAALRAARTFRAFDDLYTAPAHGFAGAEDYWRLSSAGPVLERIAVPTLLVSASDDPFLAPECYPRQTAANHPFLHLETPAAGGHVGFLSFPLGARFWHEERIAAFLSADGRG